MEELCGGDDHDLWGMKYRWKLTELEIRSPPASEC